MSSISTTTRRRWQAGYDYANRWSEAPKRSPWAKRPIILQQLFPPKAEPLAVADDDVVMQHDRQCRGGALDLLGRFDVLARRRGVAAGVVVHQDQRRRMQLQRALDHLA